MTGTAAYIYYILLVVKLLLKLCLYFKPLLAFNFGIKNIDAGVLEFVTTEQLGSRTTIVHIHHRRVGRDTGGSLLAKPRKRTLYN